MKYIVCFETINGDKLVTKEINVDYNLVIGDYLSSDYIEGENLKEDFHFNSLFIINMRTLNSDGIMTIWANAEI